VRKGGEKQMVEKLILDAEALEQMGLISEAVYIIEYDMPSPRKIPKNAKPEVKKQLEKRNKLAKEFRNKMDFLLKFKILATKHLESCWLITKDKLSEAIEEIEDLKAKMKAKGFADVDKRIRIIPILTTKEAYESFEDKKAEFLLEFAMEHIRYLEKGLEERRISDSTLWRCKKAYEHIEVLAEELRNHERYTEIIDTNETLGDLIAQMEAIVVENKKKEAKK